ncbi:MAG: alcohol dehydrogenase [Christensenellales bacterium]|jgi:alcohol dehydrogenase
MKAWVYQGAGQAALEQRPWPRIEQDTDVIVSVTRSTICTSDLHILHGAVPRAQPGVVLGHEFVGRVEELGRSVRGLHVGDRVAANCISFCGECWYCRHGFINNCQRGGWLLGCAQDGCQAEAVRVPYGQMGLTPIPEDVSDERALFVGDILASGYFGAELCAIQPGDTVAVIGAGPVGLCAMQCARLMGAGRVVAVDLRAERLALARRLGLADETAPPERAREVVDGLSEGRGADGVIEAAGGAGSFELAWQVARANAVVALVAMYEGDQVLPLPRMYGKNLIFKTGGVDAVHSARLLSLIAAGRLNTDFLITHRGSLARIEQGYRTFSDPAAACLKWVVTP